MKSNLFFPYSDECIFRTDWSMLLKDCKSFFSFHFNNSRAESSTLERLGTHLQFFSDFYISDNCRSNSNSRTRDCICKFQIVFFFHGGNGKSYVKSHFLKPLDSLQCHFVLNCDDIHPSDGFLETTLLVIRV